MRWQLALDGLLGALHAATPFLLFDDGSAQRATLPILLGLVNFEAVVAALVRSSL